MQSQAAHDRRGKAKRERYTTKALQKAEATYLASAKHVEAAVQQVLVRLCEDLAGGSEPFSRLSKAAVGVLRPEITEIHHFRRRSGALRPCVGLAQCRHSLRAAPIGTCACLAREPTWMDAAEDRRLQVGGHDCTLLVPRLAHILDLEAQKCSEIAILAWLKGSVKTLKTLKGLISGWRQQMRSSPMWTWESMGLSLRAPTCRARVP